MNGQEDVMYEETCRAELCIDVITPHVTPEVRAFVNLNFLLPAIVLL